jgi:hypothetical protein
MTFPRPAFAVALRLRLAPVLLLLAGGAGVAALPVAGAGDRISVTWTNHILTLSGGNLPAPVPILYLEAYCRPGSTQRVWDKTVIPHRTERLPDGVGGRIRLRDTLADGVVVDHEITAGEDEVDFRVTARNPTSTASAAHWVQPCMRVGGFTGCTTQDSHALVPGYARRSFIFVGGKLRRFPTEPWADKAVYTPGQVWAAPGVSRDDVNPRPLSAIVPSNGLIGCFSADGRWILATAWEPWQELFQGIITCLHSDFRIGGLDPGESKTIRGKVYVVPADEEALVRRYRRDLVSSAGR